MSSAWPPPLKRALPLLPRQMVSKLQPLPLSLRASCSQRVVREDRANTAAGLELQCPGCFLQVRQCALEEDGAVCEAIIHVLQDNVRYSQEAALGEPCQVPRGQLCSALPSVPPLAGVVRAGLVGQPCSAVPVGRRLSVDSSPLAEPRLEDTLLESHMRHRMR